MKRSAICVFFAFLSLYGSSQIGVNTENPTETLDINGTLRIRDVSTEGDASGKILVLDTNGKVEYLSAADIVSEGATILNVEQFSTGVTNPVSQVTDKTGDTYFNSSTYSWWYYNGTNWLQFTGLSTDPNNILQIGTDGLPYLASSSVSVSATNGLSVNPSDEIELGGNLTKPTQISTNTSNTLSISGLQNGNLAVDEIVTINPTTNVVTKTAASTLTQKHEVVYTASNGQTQFDTPINITDVNKIDVYRNGIRIGLTVVDTDTIELESGVFCFANDEIRIVQLN